MSGIGISRHINTTWVEWLIGIFLVLVLASSAAFFRIAFLGKNVIYLVQFAMIGLMFLLLLFQIIYWQIPLSKNYFSVPVLVLLSGVLISMYTAYAYHGQQVVISLWANRYMYFFLFYFVLHVLQVSPKYLERLLFLAGVIYALAFILQYLIYPTELFDVRMGVERGTIRIFIPGLALLNMAYLIALQKVLYKNSLPYLGFLVLFLAVFVLTGTRSIIAGPAVVTLLALFFSKRVKSRLGIMILVLFAVALAFYLFQDIVLYLVSVSEQQSAHSDENIRIQAARFFLSDFFPNTFAYITGNSEAHQASAYGLEIFSYKMRDGYYQSDIGFIGEFSKYGLFLLVSVVLIFLKGFTYPLSDDYAYVRYFMLLVLITLPLGSSFTTPDYIVILCVAMYLFDLERAKVPAVPRRKQYAVYFPEVDN